MEEKDLLKKLDELTATVEAAATKKAKDEATAQVVVFETKYKEALEGFATLKAAFDALKIDADKLKADAELNQPVIDAYVVAKNKPQIIQAKSFGDAWRETIAEQFESKRAEINSFKKDRNAKLTFELKVDNMTIANSLTGDAQASYNQRQGLIPNQKINIRDLTPTVQSPTGLYVTYHEDAVVGAVADQTEGNAKAQLEYNFTEVKVVSDYVSGWVKFSKQLMYGLPWLQSTLPRMLLRDFYKRENAKGYAVLATGTGNATVTPTVDIEQVIAWIANQRNADFNASYGIVNWADWQTLLLTKPVDYSVPGGVMIDANGNIRIAGIPIIGASWATVDKFVLVDADYFERVETESLRVEFSYEDSDNFEKNLVTARVECFEDFNLLRTDAVIYGDFGNVS